PSILGPLGQRVRQLDRQATKVRGGRQPNLLSPGREVDLVVRAAHQHVFERDAKALGHPGREAWTAELAFGRQPGLAPVWHRLMGQAHGSTQGLGLQSKALKALLTKPQSTTELPKGWDAPGQQQLIALQL
ncbi:MAG: hypothetical protein RL483_985, partial [Pseudomonadota bacterium]